MKNLGIAGLPMVIAALMLVLLVPALAEPVYESSFGLSDEASAATAEDSSFWKASAVRLDADGRLTADIIESLAGTDYDLQASNTDVPVRGFLCDGISYILVANPCDAHKMIVVKPRSGNWSMQNVQVEHGNLMLEKVWNLLQIKVPPRQTGLILINPDEGPRCHQWSTTEAKEETQSECIPHPDTSYPTKSVPAEYCSQCEERRVKEASVAVGVNEAIAAEYPSKRDISHVAGQIPARYDEAFMKKKTSTAYLPQPYPSQPYTPQPYISQQDASYTAREALPAYSPRYEAPYVKEEARSGYASGREAPTVAGQVKAAYCPKKETTYVKEVTSTTYEPQPYKPQSYETQPYVPQQVVPYLKESVQTAYLPQQGAPVTGEVSPSWDSSLWKNAPVRFDGQGRLIADDLAELGGMDYDLYPSSRDVLVRGLFCNGVPYILVANPSNAPAMVTVNPQISNWNVQNIETKYCNLMLSRVGNQLQIRVPAYRSGMIIVHPVRQRYSFYTLPKPAYSFRAGPKPPYSFRAGPKPPYSFRIGY